MWEAGQKKYGADNYWAIAARLHVYIGIWSKAEYLEAVDISKWR